MPIGDLIQPVYVIFEPHDQAVRMTDEDAREQYHGKRSSRQVVLPAQVYWDEESAQEMHVGGDQPSVSGYLVVRRVDMQAQNCNIDVKDRIVAIGDATGLDAYVTKRVRFGHWSDVGGAVYVQFFFKDRDPTTGSVP